MQGIAAAMTLMMLLAHLAAFYTHGVEVCATCKQKQPKQCKHTELILMSRSALYEPQHKSELLLVTYMGLAAHNLLY
jgi:hypothetical protein